MASSLISTNDSLRQHKKKRKPHHKDHNHHHHQQQQQQHDHTKWKSQAQQQSYSSKLRQALARVNLSSPDPRRRGKAIREAADRVLAVAAKGKTRWSRAILANRVKLKFRKQHKRQRLMAGSNRWNKNPRRFSVLRLKGKRVQRKVRVLGRLVPGCKKEALPVVLEEAIDYIPALEMQARAMTALANLLFSSSSTST